MTTINDAWQAGIDAVVADNTLNRAGFVDAMQTVITQGLSNAEGNAFVDAVAVVFNDLGQINNPTYNSLRGNIIADPVLHRSLFDALTQISALPEAVPVVQAATLMDLRSDRDNANAGIDRIDVLIAAEPSGVVGRFIKDVLREGKRQIREYKQSVRDQIQNITGDPDS
jgi:hypothetical protein